MAITYFVGWDNSKETLNYCLINGDLEVIHEGECSNTQSSIKELTMQWAREFNYPKDAFLHCVENTGHYSNPIRKAATKHRLNLWVEDGLQLKLSMGRQKNKTDKVDARLIAQYCCIHRRSAQLYQAPRDIEVQLDELQKLRTSLIRKRQSIKTSYKGKTQFNLASISTSYREINKAVLQVLNEQIKKLEKDIRKLILSDEKLKRIYQIALSVPGIGRANVLVIMGITGCFKRIKTARACACYAGVSPHPHRSGSSIRKKSKTSRAASKQLKTAFQQGVTFLLHRPSSPYYALYQRLMGKGRSHNQAANAARNKMIRILYACVKNDVMYEKKHHKMLA